MKWMKVIDTLKNMMSQEVQHGLESQLIEVMNLKMHMIQFGVIVNLIQMKRMKVIHSMKNTMNQEFQYHEEL
jgi:DNA-directed RNA polymerase beta' subunit